MATISQIQRGFTAFVDNEVAPVFNGWQKAVLAGAAALLAANLPNLVKVYGASPMVAALGVYNLEAGTVDIDKLYNAFVPHIGTDKIPVSIPKIGTIRLGKEDIDILVRYIKEA